MIAEDVLDLSVEELQKELKERQKALTNLRFQKALQQLENTDEVTSTRRSIAQIKTLLREYELGRREARNK